MPSTFPILELKQDGDVAFTRVKAVGAKPVLKDMQMYLKKKTPPTLLTSYAYAQKRLSFFGYTKGKDDEISQHQLPPPFESGDVEIYGSILLVAHALKQHLHLPIMRPSLKRRVLVNWSLKRKM